MGEVDEHSLSWLFGGNEKQKQPMEKTFNKNI